MKKNKKLEIQHDPAIATVYVPKALFKKYNTVMAVIKRNFDDADQVLGFSMDLATELVIELGIPWEHPCHQELSNEISEDLYNNGYRHTVTAIAEGA